MWLAGDFNHYRVGHAYSSVHSSSAEAAGAATASLPDMVNSTAAWHSSFFNSSLPPFLADTLVNTLSTWRTGMYFANKDWRQWETYDCVDTDPVECDASRSLPLVIMYLLRAILMSTWGFWPAVFRPLRTVFPGLGAGFLNLGGKTEGTAKKRGKNGEKWARNGLKRVG